MEPAYSPFTPAEYLDFVEEYWQSKRDGKLSRLRYLRSIYLQRLPIYLIARCPFCGGEVKEGVDTFSLNGPGWLRYGPLGHSWYGLIASEVSDKHQHPLFRESYTTKCPHIHAVDWCVNFNGHRPRDVISFWEYSETPHLVMKLMGSKGMLATIHSLPISRADAPGLQTYTVYFVSYFSPGNEILLKDEDHYLMMRPPFDYDLVNWVESNRLYWLDNKLPELPLRTGLVEEFPYKDIRGRKDTTSVTKGKFDNFPITRQGS